MKEDCSVQDKKRNNSVQGKRKVDSCEGTPALDSVQGTAYRENNFLEAMFEECLRDMTFPGEKNYQERGTS